MRFRPDAFRYGFPVLFLSAIAFFFQIHLLSLILLLTALFLFFFFRDPERKIPEGKDLILAPADGKVMEVVEAEEKEHLKQACKVVSIFLSPFDVHVTRSPLAGKVLSVKEIKGSFLPAFLSSSAKNHRKSILFKGQKFSFLVVQIAGIIARRIEYWVKAGDFVERGQRIGIIKFGSRVDLYLPKFVRVLVQKGDRVRAGETVVGKAIKK